jgi:hyperosmotically inducible protein
MKKQVITGFLALVLTAAIAVAAPAPAQANAPTNDLEKAVVQALWSLPHYGVYDNLYFETDGPNVTLKGQALFEITKAEAAKRVAKIKGIGKVTNQIEVLPPSSADDSLRMALYRNIFGTHDLYRYSMGADPTIHIIVAGGHVTLTGMVDTKEDKQKAEMVAKSTPGILSFKNDLRTEK